VENNVLIDREEELNFLNRLYASGKPQLVIIYGRRRIGKTFLIKNFIKGKKSIYYLATKEGEEAQAREISRVFADFFNDAALAIAQFTRYSQVFEYLAKKASEKLVFVIDEYGYMMESSPYVSSVLQKYWDEYLSKSNAFIILNGSVITLMESLLSKKNPLYGRRTGQWHMLPLGFKELAEFLKGRSFEEMVECWSATGTILFYAKEFLNYKSFEEFIENTFFNKGHIFYEEGRILVSDELGDVESYFSILSEIANGPARSIEIANKIGIKNTSLSKYLRKLQDIGFIGKEVPVTERQSSKKSLYYMQDNFLNFWFSFVYKNRGLIENGKHDELRKMLETRIGQFIGKAFEKLIRDNIPYFSPFNVERSGRWWGRDPSKPKGMNQEEIDVVALNEKSKDILFAECKWGSEKVGREVYEELKRKAKLVQWHNDSRHEHFALFSKSGFTDEMRGIAEKEHVLLFDLEEIEKALK
jgi:AAA+ ATPase superfamily predicted ATPase